MSTNSFAVDVCPEEAPPEASSEPTNTPSTATQTPTAARLDAQASLARRTRSDTVPTLQKAKARSRSTSVRNAPFTSLHGIAIDENAVHDSSKEPPLKVKIPLNLTKPLIGKPSKHRHSRSLPALRQEANAPVPPIPQMPVERNLEKLIRHTKSSNGG